MSRLPRFTLLLIFTFVLLATLGFVPWHPVRAASMLTVNTTADKAGPLTCGTWSVVPSPNVGSSHNSFTSVTAVSASNVWAVGTFINSSSLDQTLTEQWNGTSWKVVPSPNVGSNSNSLSSVARVPGSSNMWAVGTFSNSSGIDQTLTEFFC